MLTKKQFAEAIMREFAINSNKQVSDITSADAYKSSSLAVAMEYLGLLSKDDIEYSRTRGGVVFSSWNAETNENDCISTRDMMKLLPEVI